MAVGVAIPPATVLGASFSAGLVVVAVCVTGEVVPLVLDSVVWQAVIAPSENKTAEMSVRLWVVFIGNSLINFYLLLRGRGGAMNVRCHQRSSRA